MNQVVPFWMLNDLLRKEKLISQLKKIKKTGVNEVIVHPRFGLKTKYLSPEWFRAIKVILVWSSENNFKIWIYDEINWPSGYAGGQILKNNPELIGKCLIKTSDGFKVKPIDWKAAYSNNCYTDLLNPKTTELFISLVYEEYYEKFKDYFGTTLVGFFTDEPGLYCNFAGHNPNSIPWTKDFLKYFKKTNRYALDHHLESLWSGFKPKDIQHRVDYWKTISGLYQKSYFKQLQIWCHSKNILFVGHLLAEESIVETARTQGDFFGAMKYFDWAGYDLLSKLEQKHIITAKLALSAKHNYGLKKVCAETFGVFGWNLDINKMKLVTEWQIKNGLDVSIPHAFFYSLRGERKYDCPPSFFKEKYLNSFDDYVKGVQDSIKIDNPKKARVAIYYPRETIWGELLPSDLPENNKTEKIFNDTIFSCYNNKINFNIIDANIVNKKSLSQYKIIILPNVSIIDLKILKMLEVFTKKGKLIIIGSSPQNPTKTSDDLFFKKVINRIIFKHIFYPEKNLKTKTDYKQKLTNKIKKFIPLIILVKLKTVLEKYNFFNNTYDLSKPTVIDTELANLIKK